MKLSFIITSVNRFELLKKAIKSIEQAEIPQGLDIEIISVLQGNDLENLFLPEDTSKYLHTYKVRPIGASAARNFGIKRSTGDYLVFLDDDACVNADFLTLLGEEIIRGCGDAYCGRIIDPDKNMPYVKWFSDSCKRKLSFFDYRYFMASSLVIKKQIMDVLGYFDESFGGGAKYLGAEESDYFFRLLQKRKSIVYLPNLVFYHPLPADISAKKVFNYSHATSAMLVKQINNDPKHFYIYTLLIIDILFRSGIRVFQSLFMRSKELREKNRRYHYLDVFKGTIQGVISYIRK